MAEDQHSVDITLRAGMTAMSALAFFALPLMLIFFFMFAASGGGDCAAPPNECARTSTIFGWTALFFLLLEVFALWRIFKLARHGRIQKDMRERSDGC